MPGTVKKILYANGQILAVTNWTNFQLEPFDRIDATYPNATTEVYTYSFNGVTNDVLTVVYTDATKDLILSASVA